MTEKQTSATLGWIVVRQQGEAYRVYERQWFSSKYDAERYARSHQSRNRRGGICGSIPALSAVPFYGDRTRIQSGEINRVSDSDVGRGLLKMRRPEPPKRWWFW
jgi:hypothetical protein